MKKSTLLLAICMVLISTAFSQAGSLDSNFGGIGKLTTKIGQYAYGRAVALQADGKIIVAGSAGAGFVLVRYKRNGRLDHNFGSNGAVITDFNIYAEVFSVVIQADGKIVAGGTMIDTTINGLDHYDFALARYNSNGDLDSAFGINGKLTADFGNFDYCTSVAIQNDGKIIMAGYTSDDNEGGKKEYVLLRLKPDGHPDKIFGNNGVVITDFESYSAELKPSIAVQGDGKILLAGAGGSIYQDGFELARFKQNGKLDSSFGTNGYTVSFLQFDIAGQSIAIRADGKIVVGGIGGYRDGTVFIVLEQFTKSGKPDSAFGVNGILQKSGVYTCSSITLQPDGKIIAAGAALYRDDYYYDEFVVMRVMPNGQLDNTFGVVTTGFPYPAMRYPSKARGESVAMQPDGKIVVAGYANSSIAVARYNGDNTSAANAVNNDLANLQKKNHTSTNILLSPNPVKDILRIEGLSRSETKTISILDAKGKLLQQITTTNNSYSLNVKQLSAGIYFIRIDEGDPPDVHWTQRTAHKTTTLKFIKE